MWEPIVSAPARFLIATSCAAPPWPRVPASPTSDSAFARLRPVWPPMVGRMASGRSFSRICSTSSGVMGPTYLRGKTAGRAGGPVGQGRWRCRLGVSSARAARQPRWFTCTADGQAGTRGGIAWRQSGGLRLGARASTATQQARGSARAVGGARVSHDGGGVGVHQDDGVTLGPAASGL